jgi:hypothetical protein
MTISPDTRRRLRARLFGRVGSVQSVSATIADSEDRKRIAQRELSISLGIANGSSCNLVRSVPMVLSNSLSRFTMLCDGSVSGMLAYRKRDAADRAELVRIERVWWDRLISDQRSSGEVTRQTRSWFPTNVAGITSAQAEHLRVRAA